MIKVRKRDLALVAFAGGLLAFELVSLTEALPDVKRALAGRAPSWTTIVASAEAALAPAPVHDPAGSAASRAVVGAATGHAHAIAAATSSATAKRCVVVTRAGSVQRARGRAHRVTVERAVACPAGAAALSMERLREVEKAVELAVKRTTL